ncbi:MAG TPA: ANTAR domain-containing protein [Actinomycetospora sp.]|jgi:hypothetical protein|uniref:ANTAR domain-containing protein n=1 Tax=Actinomycetospora sp. TaxID=1872135 RepID=UPI002F415FC2
MISDDSGLGIAEQATRALGSLERYGHVLRPPDVDEVSWRLEMLDELTRAGHRLAGAVAQVVGEDDPDVTWMVRELRSAIDLHCDRVDRAVRDRSRPRPGSPGSDRVVPFPTPYARSCDDVPPPAGVVASAGTPVPGPAPAPVARSAQQVVIGAAAEVLRERHGCGVDAAYALILDRAREAGTTTYEVAVRVIDER